MSAPIRPCITARVVAALLLAMVPGGLARAEPPSAPNAADVNGFRDWIAACDNLRTCSAYGVDAEVFGNAFIRVHRGGAPDAAVRITIGVNADDGVKFTLAFDDPSLPGLPSGPLTGTPEPDVSLRRLVIAEPAAVARLLAAFRKANKLIVTRIDPPGADPSDPAVTEISLAGFAAAALWIDEQQKRVGTVTALIGHGDKPASAVPALPAAPVVRTAKLSTRPAPKQAPAAVLAMAKKACDADAPFTAPEQSTRLSGEQVMYWFRCEDMSGMYNYYYTLVIAAPGRSPRVAKFPFPPESVGQDGDDGDTIVNPILDAKTGTLTTLNKARGLSDCGGLSEWAWDGAVFRMIASRAMPSCKGIPAEDWPTLFRAVRK